MKSLTRGLIVLGLLGGLVGVGNAALRLTWQDNSNVETAYWVLRQRVPAEKGFTLVKELAAGATSWIDTTTRKRQRYCYVVVAIKGTERSYSNVACGEETENFSASFGVIRVTWGISPSRQFNAYLDK